MAGDFSCNIKTSDKVLVISVIPVKKTHHIFFLLFDIVVWPRWLKKKQKNWFSVELNSTLLHCCGIWAVGMPTVISQASDKLSKKQAVMVVQGDCVRVFFHQWCPMQIYLTDILLASGRASSWHPGWKRMGDFRLAVFHLNFHGTPPKAQF